MSFSATAGFVACLLGFPGSLAAAIGAIAFLGLASGAELDIITYIVVRRFGQEVFGAVYSIFMAVVSVCASVDPVIAGAVFDASHSYVTWLMIVALMVLAAAAVIALIPIVAETDAQDQDRDGTDRAGSARSTGLGDGPE